MKTKQIEVYYCQTCGQPMPIKADACSKECAEKQIPF